MTTTLEIDEELRTAALNGDVDFLRKCVASNKPISYYLTYFPQIQSGDTRYGNIFHIAADRHNVEFISEAIRILPLENTQQLLLQSWSETNKWNPLHIAAYNDKEIVKIFLDVYRSLPSLPSDQNKRPWLMKLRHGSTPCHMAVYNYNEEGALELLGFDTELICNMTAGIQQSSILYDAVHKKLSKVALEILRSPHPISFSGYKGNNPLHWMHYFSRSEEAEEIFRLLLRRGPELIKQKSDEGLSPFHTWAYDGTTIWPFKSLLESHDIIPNIKRVFVDLTVETDDDGRNPLHYLACNASSEEVAVEIAELLINIYMEQTSSEEVEVAIAPWLVKSDNGGTPLSLAIEKGYEKLAMYLLSVDKNVVINSHENALFLAIENGRHEVAKRILEILDNNKWTELLTKDQQNVLHLAPLCQENFYTQLIKMHPDLIRGVKKGGITILHSWMRNIKVGLFEYLLRSEYKSHLIKLVTAVDYANGNNPIHCGATSINEDTIHVVKLLVNAYKEEYPYWKLREFDGLPWFAKNIKDKGPLQLAISNQHENLALYILSLHQDEHFNTLLDYYKPKHSTLFLAIQNNCFQVAKRIMEKLDQESWTNYLMDSSSGENILHLATCLTADENFVTWLVNKAPHFVTKQDNNRQSPWDKAHEIGSTWFIKAVLQKDPLVFRREPLAWTKACQKGHVVALRAIINHNPGAFRDLCIQHKDSPLHHIRLSSLTDYEEFFKIPRMKDFINVQNDQDETPLHRAIRKEDIFLTEILLNVDKIIYTINDNKNVTAIDLLAHLYKENVAWGQMCKRNGLDLSVKTTYFQHKTNLIDVRTSLFVVAALLATITFTAGFTLPGGINQDTGDAVLARKASFIVFLLSDTLAFFFSMLVLICLTWSMVFDRSQSLILIDRSMVLLRIALNLTLLAFMTGVYIVIARKILWVAILIIVIISSLIIISINKNVLYKVMDKFPTTTKERRDPMQLIEMGYQTNEEQDSFLSHHGGQSSPNQRSMGNQNHKKSS